MVKKIFRGVAFLFIMEGCSLLLYTNKLLLLKQVADNQGRIAEYLTQQEAGFHRLEKAVREGKLREGLPDKDILKIYGEPIIIKTVENSQKVWFYRHPTKYFSSPRIYLYFDSNQCLSRWEYKKD